MATATKAAKKNKRDANVPVLHFKINGTEYKIKVANPGDVVRCEYNPKHSWVPNKTASLIVVRQDQHGIHETEEDIFNASTWGWLGRLLSEADQDQPPIKIELLSKTDRQIFNGE